MTSTDTLERELVRDIDETAPERLADERFSTDLYRALASVRWRHEGEDGALSLSWTRAEELVNGLRERHGHAPLTLAQTGGEGVVSDLVDGELARRGWRHEPLNTGRHDDRHSGSPAEPPPADHSGPDWERRAHAEAERERLR